MARRGSATLSNGIRVRLRAGWLVGDLGEVGPVRQDLQHRQSDGGRDSPDQRGAAGQAVPPHLEGEEPAVRGDQHLRGEGADQRFGEFPFALVDGARVDREDGAGAGFGEPDSPGLREGSLGVVFGFAVVLQILLGVGHVDHHPVQGHDPPVPDPRPGGAGLRDRYGDSFEQHFHRLCSEPFPGLG